MFSSLGESILGVLMRMKAAIATSDRKDFSLTFIRVVCAIAVVTLHTNGCFWDFSSTERYWYTANIIESVFYFAVPLFFMITGITLLDYQKRYSTREFFKKRIEKTVIPYVFWSLIGIVFLLATGKLEYEEVTFTWVVNGLLSTDRIINLYWFFQPLFCVYLCIPVFAAISDEKKEYVANYIVLFGFFFNIFMPFLNNVLHLGVPWPYSLSVASGYVFWIWTGYKIYNYPPSKRQKTVIYVFALLGLFLHIIGTYNLSIEAGSIQSLYKGYNNLPCVLYSLGVFVMLRDIARLIEKSRKVFAFVSFLGKYTFPLYLIHWFVLRIQEDLIIIDTRSIIYRLFAPYCIFVIVICIAWVLRKIPYIRKIVP